jgi:hypothetical protein
LPTPISLPIYHSRGTAADRRAMAIAVCKEVCKCH